MRAHHAPSRGPKMSASAHPNLGSMCVRKTAVGKTVTSASESSSPAMYLAPAGTIASSTSSCLRISASAAGRLLNAANGGAALYMLPWIGPMYRSCCRQIMSARVRPREARRHERGRAVGEAVAQVARDRVALGDGEPVGLDEQRHLRLRVEREVLVRAQPAP